MCVCYVYVGIKWYNVFWFCTLYTTNSMICIRCVGLIRRIYVVLGIYRLEQPRYCDLCYVCVVSYRKKRRDLARYLCVVYTLNVTITDT